MEATATDPRQANLADAIDGELLRYCSSLDPDELIIGTMTGVQQQLKLMAMLLISSPPISELIGVELSTTLELLSRRLEVACELMRREQQVTVTEQQATGAEGANGAGTPAPADGEP